MGNALGQEGLGAPGAPSSAAHEEEEVRKGPSEEALEPVDLHCSRQVVACEQQPGIALHTDPGKGTHELVRGFRVSKME
jgi:hypothetical protein